ncbi:hypothetical protein [Pseudaminobacter sp. NGMCC 1.201702]|uniref:hypothetical protein n=1 Tax=Pseudaminobacter sp. NGMCC 1.201702 TaxID=3391825 RepID=UPI0039EDF91A
MTTKKERELNKAQSGTAKSSSPEHKGGDQTRKAQEWGGGSKAAKGPITKADHRNPNSSQKS